MHCIHSLALTIHNILSKPEVCITSIMFLLKDYYLCLKCFTSMPLKYMWVFLTASLRFSEAITLGTGRAIPVNASAFEIVYWIAEPCKEVCRKNDFHVVMTVVTNKGVKLDGDLNCGFSLKNLRQFISFGTVSPVTPQSLHQWRPGACWRKIKNNWNITFTMFTFSLIW